MPVNANSKKSSQSVIKSGNRGQQYCLFFKHSIDGTGDERTQYATTTVSLYQTFFKNLHPTKCFSSTHPAKLANKPKTLKKREEMNLTMSISVAFVILSSTKNWIRILTCHG